MTSPRIIRLGKVSTNADDFGMRALSHLITGANVHRRQTESLALHDSIPSMAAPSDRPSGSGAAAGGEADRGRETASGSS
jgi:hypothetical protein